MKYGGEERTRLGAARSAAAATGTAPAGTPGTAQPGAAAGDLATGHRPADLKPADIPPRNRPAADSVPAELARSLARRLNAGDGQLPLPGSGRTLQRWQALADVAAEDLALAKLFEGHTDALAIMAELGGAVAAPGSVWGTWAAEPPTARLELHRTADGARLTGRKAWCSGAGIVTDAVVTAWDRGGAQCLAAVSVGQPAVTVTTEGWHAVGMGRAASGDVLFDHAPAAEIGEPGQYTARPGFWQGGCGIAACWYGGALPLAAAVADLVARRDDPHAAAHLGAIDAALSPVRTLLAETAAWIDAHPGVPPRLQALRARAAAEEAAGAVLSHAGRALGAGPLCRDMSIARRFADLPVYVRQSHAERDLAQLGRVLGPARANPTHRGGGSDRRSRSGAGHTAGPGHHRVGDHG